ncbi:MAG: oxygen-independent coproporphyrinogen III oxidase [Saprospiraceae bacterium]|nr:oxygen-independent coproporphyrinogen III oxidase [Saprospiraceae bacterium]
MNTKLLRKYDLPVPRYTSYPTVPYWDSTPSEQLWKEKVLSAFELDQGISLYIHLPYCEKLCTYCGCNKHITKNHLVEQPYIDSVLKEWDLYLDVLGRRPILKELHLGGGTPTFFSPESLRMLVEGIRAKAIVPEDADFSFEAHPASTSWEHLSTLREVGFKRLSIGVQDFSPIILEIINRQQTAEQVENVTQQARALGYSSINYDLIFGLPLQDAQAIRNTMARVAQLRPDRIAFYSYAHVPWIKPSQRAYSEADLPLGDAKRELYELGRALLESEGYKEIGLDHFALASDELYHAYDAGNLHRNFMGYTPAHTRLSIGLGASAISDSWDAYVQNEKKIVDYRARVAQGQLPFFKGHVLTYPDQIIRKHILNLMCQHETQWIDPALQDESFLEGIERMEELEKDGLIRRDMFSLVVTKEGLPFLRNICQALDARLWQRKPTAPLFSSAI